MNEPWWSDFGYGCFWDSAFGPCAFFKNKAEAIRYATTAVAETRIAGRWGRMHIHFRKDGGPFEETPVWNSGAS